MLFQIDEQMNLIPTKMVSRIRRDTRRSKNKEMYRDNMWCMFMRNKQHWRYQPCMWFEFYPDFYSYGIGTFRSDTLFQEYFREYLAENQEEFREAIRILSVTGATLDIECFKKDKPGIERVDDDLRKFYNCKYFYSTDNATKFNY